MNYFAHGIRYVDRPYFLAGTAVPDWLSVVDRKVRMRTRNVRPFSEPERAADEVQREVALGVLQHLHDDQWFHDSEAFLVTSAELGQMFRQLPDTDDGFRAGFLGHIVTELLIDAALIERHPERLDAYYESVRRIDQQAVQRAVNAMARNQTQHLAPFIPRFVEVRFLADYLEDTRLQYRLNQVLGRIRLKPLPKGSVDVLQRGRRLIRERVDDLLPPAQFDHAAITRN